METLKLFAAFTSLAVLLPLSAIYFYRSYVEDTKRLPKIMKGFNYIYFTILLLHGVWGRITITEFATFMLVGIFLLGIMELSYHIDVLLDIIATIKARQGED